MKGLTLRELINRLEELSRNGLNDGMPVEISDPDFSNYIIKGAFIGQFNNAGTFDESSDSYEYVSLVIG